MTTKDTEAERRALAIAMRYPDCLPTVLKTRATDYIDPMYRAIRKAMEDCQLAGEPVAAPFISARLKADQQFEGNPAFHLMALDDEATVRDHVGFYVDRVLAAGLSRSIIDVCQTGIDAARNGVGPSTALNDLLESVDSLRRNTSPNKTRFPILTASELAAGEFPIRYIVDRALVEHQFCFLGGPKKALKTSLAVALAISIALGVRFLNRFEVDRPRRVLVCSCEAGLGALKDVAKRICKSMGVDLADIGNLMFSPVVPRPGDSDNWSEFAAVLESKDPEVLILDPFYRMVDGDGAENLFKMGIPLGRIDDLCKSLGVTVVLAHHLKTSRLNQFAPADLDDLAFAGGSEFARQWLMVARREAYADGTGVHRLWLRLGGSAGHSSLWGVDVEEGSNDDAGGRRWYVETYKADETIQNTEQRAADLKAAAAEKQFNEDREAACRVLAKNPAGLSMSAIGERAAIGTRRWPKVFAKMLDDGELVACDIKVSNHKTPKQGYKLPPRTEPIYELWRASAKS